MPNFSTSAEFLRGLIARASSGGNSSFSISISGWSRGTSIEALGFLLAMRGRSALDFRSGSVSEAEEEEEAGEGCEFSLSWLAVEWFPLVVPLELLSFEAGEGIELMGSEEL